MFLELLWPIMGLVVVCTIGKLLLILELKIKSKLVSLHQKHLILIAHSATIHLVGLTTVHINSNLGLGQLRHGSNATGPAYGKRFKKEGVLGICLDMNKGTLSFSLNG